MTVTAIAVLVLSALLIWGGLVLSIVLLRRDGRLVTELEARDGDDEGPYRGPRQASDV
jgi:hypothetical protein